jgi:diaminopimelate decarboxylase
MYTMPKNHGTVSKTTSRLSRKARLVFFMRARRLTNINILKHIRSLGCNVDCSSINEVKLAVHAGFQKENILYTSNGIAFSEIEEAVGWV